MKIRPATTKDISWIIEIFIEESKKEPYNENWDFKTANKKIREEFKNKKFFILEDKKKIGFIVLSTYPWEKTINGNIELLAVSSEEQGKGYGKKLLDFSEDFFKRRKIKKITLYSEIGSVAFEIYKKRNYKETKLLMMEKNL